MDGSNFNGWVPEDRGRVDEAARSAIARSVRETALFFAALVLIAVLVGGS